MSIVTISRGSFSGGKAVAEELARRLGWPTLGREEVLQEVAARYAISEADLTAALDQPPSFWEQQRGQRLAYVTCVAAVLLDRARRGPLVYHGHVGHLLLSRLDHVLRVRVLAPLERRIAAAMARNNLTRDAARAYIQRMDKARARWAQALYGVDWTDPRHYDLVLHLDRLPLDGACAAIQRLLELPQFQSTAQTRQKLDDHWLRCRVEVAMARHPEIGGAGLHVEAAAGRVVITGSVGSSRARDAIQRVAGEVGGVKSLQCEVGVGSDWYW